MSKKITLRAWAIAQGYDPVPSNKTLQRWARDCWIWPLPQKVGRDWRVDSDAKFTGPEMGRGSKAA